MSKFIAVQIYGNLFYCLMEAYAKINLKEQESFLVLLLPNTIQFCTFIWVTRIALDHANQIARILFFTHKIVNKRLNV